jgi:hypothetical protein
MQAKGSLAAFIETRLTLLSKRTLAGCFLASARLASDILRTAAKRRAAFSAALSGIILRGFQVTAFARTIKIPNVVVDLIFFPILPNAQIFISERSSS